MEFQAEGEIITPLEVEMKRDERIIRFLNVRMDKHHVDYAKVRRQKLQNA